MAHSRDNTTRILNGKLDWFASTLRVFVLAVGAAILSLSVTAGISAYQVYQAEQQVDTWFKAGSIAEPTQIDTVRNQLQQADAQEQGDAKAKLSLAKLYILLAEREEEPAYYNAARQMANAASRLQPVHYEAYALLSEVDSQQGFSLFDSLVNLEKAVTLGGLEETVQPIIGPIVVKKWPYLPEALKAASGPLIKSMLSEAGAREIIIAAMEENERAGPFTQFSPNKKTSALLREMDARFSNT